MEKNKRKLPKHLSTTQHRWRVRKRSELRRAIEAVEECFFGAAYTPTGNRLDKVRVLLAECADLMSQKNWGK